MRKSNFEILRIIAILAIVASHFVSQSDLSSTAIYTNRAISILLGSASRIAVNIFLLIGAWFMTDSRFRPERILRLYCQVFLYTLPLTLLMLCMGRHGSIRNLIQGFLPFLGRPLWFATAYMSLVALSPFLNLVFKLERRALSSLVILLFVSFTIIATVPSYTPYEYLADFAWFIVVYIFVGWAKMAYLWNRFPNGLASLGIGLALYAALALARLCQATSWMATYWSDHLQCLPNILVASLVFNAFRRWDIGCRRWINWLANSVFAVYIVHQVPAFREYEWNSLCRAEALRNAHPLVFLIGLVGIPMAIFLIIAVVDHVYRLPIERKITRSRLFGLCCRHLRSLYPQSMLS